MSIRIWHQSYTDLSRLPGYRAMMAEHAARIGSEGTVVDLHGLRPGTYPEGMPPIAMVGYRYATRLADIQVIENCVRAEREGYDAVAISCFLDPGLEEARSVVNIPVVSSCETALLMSSLIGRSVGLVTLEETMARYLRGLVAHYGYAERAKFVEAMDPPIDEYELDAAFAGSPAFVERFSRDVTRLAGRGVDVIIPAEGVVNIALVKNNVSRINGMAVLDSYGALIRMAETAVALRHLTGFEVSRQGVYATPPQGLVPNLRGIVADVMRGADS
jgi:allantoin racemase